MHIFAFILVLLSSQTVMASDQFLPLREDFNVPGHCEEVSTDLFVGEISRFYYGRKGATQFGFTFEYPLERRDATTLWKYFNTVVEGTPDLDLFRKIKQDPAMYRDYKIIMATYAGMGVDFGNEGDVLEVLATYDMHQRFPAPVYYVTGGIEYREGLGMRTIGEIDLMVGLQSTCKIVHVGEVKLGSKGALSKATSQLGRFSNFLRDQGVAGLSYDLKANDSRACSAENVVAAAQ